MAELKILLDIQRTRQILNKPVTPFGAESEDDFKVPFPPTYRNEGYVLTESLRETAIEHIKYLKTRLDPKKEYEYRFLQPRHEAYDPITHDEARKAFFKSDMESIWKFITECKAQIRWIKYFFSLNEEDTHA